MPNSTFVAPVGATIFCPAPNVFVMAPLAISTSGSVFRYTYQKALLSSWQSRQRQGQLSLTCNPQSDCCLNQKTSPQPIRLPECRWRRQAVQKDRNSNLCLPNSALWRHPDGWSLQMYMWNTRRLRNRRCREKWQTSVKHMNLD